MAKIKAVHDSMQKKIFPVKVLELREREREEREQERVWWAADTLDNSGNEALAESDNYFN